MVVEQAGAGDIQELTELRLAYLREDLGPMDDREAQTVSQGLPAYFRTHLGRDLSVYVIRAEGRIVSCAFLLAVEKPMSPAFPNGMTGTVLNVYTRPSDRRKGYAKSIMEALIADAKERRLSVVELKSTEAGYPLYLAAGFSEDRSNYRLMKWTNF